VGTTTFGKGIVQKIFPMSDGSALKLTISHYYTPKGRNIHEVGVEPDVVVEFDGEAYYDEGVDNQLEEATAYMKTELLNVAE
jgi:carboxyl-terminal processing protease